MLTGTVKRHFFFFFHSGWSEMQRYSGRRKRRSGKFALRLQGWQGGDIWLVMGTWAEPTGESGLGNKEPNQTTV